MYGINEPPVWDLWTISKNPAIFRCNSANSSKNRDFSILQDFSLQHNLYNVAICNERIWVRKWSELRCSLTTEIRTGLPPWGRNRFSVLTSNSLLREREREREFIGTNIKQFHAKIKLRRWDTEKKPAKQVVSSGAPRKFHKFLTWFKVDGRISANLIRL